MAHIRIIPILTLGCALAYLSSCTRYIERQTQPAPVPPATGQVPGAAPAKQPATAATDEVANTRAGLPPSEPADINLEAFRKAYDHAGKPSIMIYLNRQLSADVIPWKMRHVTVLVQKSTKTVAGEKTSATSEATSRELSTGMRGSQTGMASMEGEWTWAFENGLYNAFLEAGARIVDRDMAMRKRLLAVPLDYADAIEMQCIEDNVDILIEVLVLRNPSSLLGYEFKATAKSVDDAGVLFLVTSLDWEADLDLRQQDFVATDHGYEIEERLIIPSVQEMAGFLASDMMAELSARWLSEGPSEPSG
jgi:hypothetical protein